MRDAADCVLFPASRRRRFIIGAHRMFWLIDKLELFCRALCGGEALAAGLPASTQHRWLARVPASLLTIIVVSLITGWVATQSLGSVPSVSSSAAAIVQIEPP